MKMVLYCERAFAIKVSLKPFLERSLPLWGARRIYKMSDFDESYIKEIFKYFSLNIVYKIILPNKIKCVLLEEFCEDPARSLPPGHKTRFDRT